MMLSMMHDSASFCMKRCWKLYLGAAALASAAAAAAEAPLELVAGGVPSMLSVYGRTWVCTMLFKT